MKKKKQETIWISLDGHKKEVPKSAYITAKTKSLIEFGYTTLTEDEVSKGLDKALSGNADEIISMFIEGDLLKD